MCHIADSTDAPHPGQVLDTTTNKWSNLPDLPPDGDSHHGYIWAYAGAFEHGTFFVFGNTQKQTQKNFKARSYHPTTGWSTERGIESYVRGLQGSNSLGNAVGHNGKLYLLGWDSLTPQIIIYDVGTKQMSLGPSDPDGPRHSFTMGIFNGAIFIAGGQTYANKVLSSVWRLEVGGNAWQRTPPIPGGDFHTNLGTSAEVDGGWWIRFRDDPSNVLGKVWVYDGSTWRQNGNYPGSQGQHYSSTYGTKGEWNCAQFATASA